MEKIETRSTSKYSAVVSDIVVRQTEQIRLVFRPTIVDNSADPAACINGTFIYQRKGKTESWTDAAVQSLATLKKGEGYQLQLHATELLQLLRSLSALYKLHQKEGVPQGKQQFIRLERTLARLLQLTEGELHEFLSAHSSDALLSLRRVAQWLAKTPTAAQQMIARGELVHLNALVGLANLKALLAVWNQNHTNGDEGFWQKTLADHAFVLSQLLAYPIVVIHDKPYLGGKLLDNQHGKYGDFIARIPASGGAVLIEIKTPQTPLVGPKYRQDVYPPSPELAGAVTQVLTQRDAFMQQFYYLTQGDDGWLGVEPKCIVLAGAALAGLASSQKKSFELFRERLAGVTIITFDELFSRVASLIELLETAEGPGSETA